MGPQQEPPPHQLLYTLWVLPCPSRWATSHHCPGSGSKCRDSDRSLGSHMVPLVSQPVQIPPWDNAGGRQLSPCVTLCKLSPDTALGTWKRSLCSSEVSSVSAWSLLTLFVTMTSEHILNERLSLLAKHCDTVWHVLSAPRSKPLVTLDARCRKAGF